MTRYILAAYLFLFISNTTAQKDNGEECSCFRTNGTSAGYFTSHHFYDYRNVTGASAVPDVITDANATTYAPPTSDFLTGGEFAADWIIETWNNSDQIGAAGSDATTLMVNSANNVYIGRGFSLSISITCI